MGFEMGDLEKAVLSAILSSRNRAYGIEIRDYISMKTGNEVSLSAIYSTLDRLERKKLLKSELGEKSPERGGRAKVYFSVTGNGQVALRESLVQINALINGLALT